MTTLTFPPKLQPSLQHLALVCVAIFPVSFLSIRHGVHFSLYGLLILGFLLRIQARKAVSSHSNHDPIIFIVSGALASLFIATLISELFRLDFNWSSLDGPSRLLIAGLILSLFRSNPFNPLKILEWAIPVGLIILLIFLMINFDANNGWQVAGIQRMSSSFVDPNTLGSQTMILGLICFLMIGVTPQKSRIHLMIKMLGGCSGLYLSIATASRGGWLALPFIFGVWLIIHLYGVRRLPKNQQPSAYLKYIIALIVCLAALGLLFNSSSIFSMRVQSAHHEITGWLEGTDMNGAAGIRLSMWKIAFTLIQEHPWLGIGEQSIAQLLANHPLNIPIYHQAIHDLIAAGPHSDILAKTLSHGVLGLVAYLCTLGIPLAVFIQHLHHQQHDAQMASHIGTYYIVGLFACGLTNEMLSLKYLCSFYGLMIACLIHQTLNHQDQR